MIINAFSFLVFSSQSAEIKNIYCEQPPYQPPLPGEALNFPYDTINDESTASEPIQITTETFSDVVISMLEQVDESIYLSYLENITGFGPRRTGTSACVAAAEYIYNQFASMDLAVRYHHWTNGGYTSDNVEATLNGTDESSDLIFIVCAHYDTVSSSPGADDDGSGTVAVLVSAYIMSQYQFNHTIKFVTFSGEEQGLLGSQVYAQEAKAQGWNIGGVLNADMISYAITENHGKNLVVYKNSASAWLYTYTININNIYSSYIGSLTLHDGGTSSGSDHYYFWQNGFSAIFYFEYEMTPYYHTSGDTIDHINATYAVKNVKLILATLAELAEPGFPSNKPEKPVLTGPTMVTVNEVSKYTVVSTDPDDDQIYYYIDWGDETNTGWIGPYDSGVPTQFSHVWTGLGSFFVKARAKDINGVRGDWSDPLIVTVTDNRRPYPPVINGPARVKVGSTQQYEISSVDPDGQDVYFFVFWGDGNSTDWIGPYNSGELITLTHEWDKKGSYTISVKSKDTAGYESNWSQLKINAPRNTNFANILLYQFLHRLQVLKGRIINFFL